MGLIGQMSLLSWKTQQVLVPGFPKSWSLSEIFSICKWYYVFEDAADCHCIQYFLPVWSPAQPHTLFDTHLDIIDQHASETLSACWVPPTLHQSLPTVNMHWNSTLQCKILHCRLDFSHLNHALSPRCQPWFVSGMSASLWLEAIKSNWMLR